MKIYSIASLLLFFAVWALLFVSFVNPWYKYTQNYRTDQGVEYRNFELNFYPLNVKFLTSNLTFHNERLSYHELINTDFWVTNIPLTFTRFIQTSISFSILAWFTTTVLLAMTFFDMYNNEKRWLVIGKYLGFVVVVFSFLSFIIYVAFKSQYNRDCKTIFGGHKFCDNNGSDEYSQEFGFFNGKFIGSTKLSKFGPMSGWNCVVIAFGISLIGSIFNVIFFNKK